MACGVVVSACIGDGGPTLRNIIGGHPAAMGMGSMDGLGAGIMGTTA